MNDEQVRQHYFGRAWEALQRERAEKLGKRKNAGRKPRPKPEPQLPPAPTDEEYQRWLDEQQCAGRTV